VANSNEPSYWRDMITKILVEDNDDFDVSDSDLASRKKWRRRQLDRNKTIPGYEKGLHTTEWERTITLPDGDTEEVYEEVIIEFAAEWQKGYRGSRDEPPEPSGWTDIHIIDVYLSDPAEAKGGVLSVKEKDAIENWFDKNSEDIANEELGAGGHNGGYDRDDW